jgi:RluA family pseudouridine synthase
LDLLYEDADVVAVLKPAGIAVIPGRNERPEDALRTRIEAERHEPLWVVHRLDRDTSGVLLFARNEQSHRRLSMAFGSRQIAKTYLAWTRGVPSPGAGVVDVPLHSARKNKMRPAAPGEAGALPSRTEYRALQVTQSAVGAVARVEARPTTGRQHQIRVHLRSVGAPLLVDPLYGGDAVPTDALGPGSPAMGRLTLHAASIAFAGPAGPILVTAPVPPDLAALDAWLARAPV